MVQPCAKYIRPQTSATKVGAEVVGKTAVQGKVTKGEARPITHALARLATSWVSLHWSSQSPRRFIWGADTRSGVGSSPTRIGVIGVHNQGGERVLSRTFAHVSIPRERHRID